MRVETAQAAVPRIGRFVLRFMPARRFRFALRRSGTCEGTFKILGIHPEFWTVGSGAISRGAFRPFSGRLHPSIDAVRRDVDEMARGSCVALLFGT